MFEVFVPGPDLPLMDRLDAFRKGFQGVIPIENAPRTVTKGAHHSLGLGTSQQHDGRSTVRVPRLLKDPDTCFRAVLELFADECDVCFVRRELATNFLRTAAQGFDRETFSPM